LRDRGRGFNSRRLHLYGALRPVWSEGVSFVDCQVQTPGRGGARVWCDALGIDRSEILRDALHRHLVVLNGEADAQRWEEQPATEAERSLNAIAAWGPAEDWSDWGDAEG
jgi:hypothetical protein